MGKFDKVLILSDMDGTLLDSAAQVSEENIRAIDFFIKNGGLFSVATGRSKSSLERFLPRLPLSAPAVVSNGAAIFDFEKNCQIWQLDIGAPAFAMAKAVRENFDDVGIEIYHNSKAFVASMNQITARHLAYIKEPVRECPLESIPQPWLNMLLTREDEKMPRLREFIEERFKGEFFMQYSSGHFLEVMHKDANKGVAALQLCNILGVPADMLYAVGDGPNDEQLISCTKNSFAPQNACKQIIDEVSYVLPDNDRHCIAALIGLLDRQM